LLRTILVPLDGTDFGEAAVPLAAAIARAASGSIHLALAHRPVVPIVPMIEPTPHPTNLDEDLRRRELAYLEGRVQALSGKGSPPATFGHLDGSAGEAVVAEASRIGADLIVMAAHGRGAIGRFWLGSITDYVIRHADVPVLVVHPDGGNAPPSEPPAMRRFLVPLDLSAESDEILETVAELAVLFQSSVTLLHVVEPFFDLVDPAAPYPLSVDHHLTQGRLDEGERRLARASETLRDAGIVVETKILESATAAGGILEVLERNEADVVAMTTNGAGGVRRMLVGSVADKVIRGSRKPTLVRRPLAAKGKTA
jgi:nucleotide-binding universal stress UspA family protein